MSRGNVRSLIPPMHADLSTWPMPPMLTLAPHEILMFDKRRQAVEMYAHGISFAEIVCTTGVVASEVRRMVNRCVSMADAGAIYGFTALLPHSRIAGYTRIKPITRVAGTLSSGCAGALEMVLQKFPEVKTLIEGLYFKDPSFAEAHEVRIPITQLHKRFVQLLRQKGFSDADWPFNTSNVGYNALATYCRKLRLEDASQSMGARSGSEALRRQRIENGTVRLLNVLRPYSFMDLDFHKIDAASTIVVENALGVELEVPVSRWHIGVICCEFSHAISGVYVSLETTPSSDCTLETLDSALRPGAFPIGDPRAEFVPDGKVLVHQLIPALEWQSFSVLRVDNAWSNCANDVVNNIIETVGCAVQFGPVRAWWTRHTIERLFGALERRGLQRLPSTYGAGVADSRRQDPAAQATRFKIRLSDLVALIHFYVREHNLSQTKALHHSSPVKVLERSLELPKSGFFSAPLPRETQRRDGLLQHIEEVTVRGNVKKGKRPYFVSDGCVYRNEELSNAYYLIGKKLVIHVCRRDCRVVDAFVKDTGEDLGRMQPERKWANHRCSWRLRKLINKAGAASLHHQDSYDAVSELMDRRCDEVIVATDARRGRNAKATGPTVDVRKNPRAALRLAKTTREQPVPEEPLDSDDWMPPAEATIPTQEEGCSGINNPPDLFVFPPSPPRHKLTAFNSELASGLHSKEAARPDLFGFRIPTNKGEE
jgi:hypothetical protein